MGIDNRLIVMAGQVPDFSGGYISARDAGLKHGAMERQIQDQNRMSQILSQKPANMPMSEFMSQQGMGDKSLEYGKQEADIAKTQAEIQSKDIETKLKKLDVLHQFAQSLTNPGTNKQTFITGLTNLKNMGILDDTHIQATLDEINGMPDTPESWAQYGMRKADQSLKAKDSLGFKVADANAKLSADTQANAQAITALNNDRGYKTDMVRLNRDIQNDEFRNALDTKKFQFEQDKLTNPQLKLSEAQKKQIIGVQNTKNAIQEYRDQLKGFGVTDLLSPDSRAAMGTKYNNMMLQAKEAYNLGVLNGPDFEILQSVITDPRSMKGAITSKEALDNQAKELDRIMSQIQKVSGGDLKAERTGATESYGDDIVNKEAQRLGKDPAKIKAFLDWKAGQK